MSPRRLFARHRTTAVGMATVGALVASVTLLPADAAPRVSVNQIYNRPGDGTFTVLGRGYGHGRGMSQHGAQGAALAGLSHEQIVAFYYPGTELRKVKRRLRVLITSDTTSDVVVNAAPGLQLRDQGAGTTLTLPSNGASRWRITVDGSGRDVVQYLAGSSWRSWRPNGPGTLRGVGEFRRPGPIELVTPSGTTAYRGWLRAAPSSSGSTNRDTVNVVRLDAYVRGVVPAEMPALWRPEAVQSQAVAARTYAMWHRHHVPDRYYHLCDTTSCQVYRGVSGEHPAADAAVRATRGQILTYDGAPAFTQFSASSGGWTAAGSAPYLRAQRDPYDNWSGNSHHRWSVPLRVRRIENAYPRLGRLNRIRVTARTGDGEWQGRVLSMVLDGSRNDVRLTGDDFRWKFGLKSTWFSFR